MLGRVLVRDPTLPDLMVDGIAARDAPLAAGATDPEAKEVTVLVANHGGAAPALRLSFSDSAGAHALSDLVVPSLAAGASFPATFRWDGTGIVGTVTLHAESDATGLATEGPGEANNDASVPVSFLLAASTGVALLHDA
ncbi:MAG: hypothetical protein QOE90_3395 [Thermoplasmata archaeon]|jgi:hypothetical protein|nr:hypothetical protein [Thermoplasmata archaeon]